MYVDMYFIPRNVSRERERERERERYRDRDRDREIMKYFQLCHKRAFVLLSLRRAFVYTYRYKVYTS